VRRKRKPRMIFYVPFWILIVGMFIGLMAIQFSRYEDYRLQLDRLSAELNAEEQVAADLRQQQAFYGSDAHIERLARELLNYVRHDEIIFRNIAE